MGIELPQEKKLIVECRIEGGCLGPTGDDYVEDFCDFVKSEFSSWETNIITWEITPRWDKSQLERQYKVAGRNISWSQAEKYLKLFEKNIDELEAEIDESIMVLITEYMSKQRV